MTMQNDAWPEDIRQMRQVIEEKHGKTPEQLFAEREKRLNDAFDLKQPDRIPINMMTGYFTGNYGGMTNQELHENPLEASKILEKLAMDYEPDVIASGFASDPTPHQILGDRMTRWPGHQLDANGEFQFAEQEFMKAEDYDDFLEDPVDWSIRTYLPRAFSSLEGLSNLGPLGMTLFGCYHVFGIASYAAPPVAEAFAKIAEAARAAADRSVVMAEVGRRMVGLGFPSLSYSLLEAPYDFMSDTLRGMKGIMLDILLRPDKLLLAEEKVSRILIDEAIHFAKVTGIKRAMLPLHRGSDGFMSIPHFEKYYWPQLKNLLLELIDNGIMPGCFYEGVWDKRLEYLAELPKGKTFGMFQSSDIFKVKEVLGDTMCIFGGMPNSLLQSGTPEEVRAYTKKLCEKVGKGGGFIMSTGVGEMSGCKPELVKAWVEATREYGRY